MKKRPLLRPFFVTVFEQKLSFEKENKVRIKIIIFCLVYSFYTKAINDNESTELKMFINQALQSDSINKHIVAGLIIKSYDLSFTNEHTYLKALKLNPDNILLLEQLIRHCHNENEEIFCQNEEYIKKLLDLDAENAVPYLYASIYYNVLGKHEKALELLQIGASKAKFETYIWKNFDLTRKALFQDNFTKEAVLVVAVKNAQVVEFTNEIMAKAIGMCAKQSKNNTEWKNACIKFGTLMEVQAKTMISAFVGLAIQKRVLENDESDFIELEHVIHRRDVFHQFRLRIVNNLEWASMTGVENTVPEQFWIDLMLFGERVAYQKALDRYQAKVD